MSGRRIDDHASWVGKGRDGSVFPEGSKMKEMRGAEGDGALGRYEDSEEAIVAQQKAGVAKARSQPQKPSHRN